MTYRRRAPLAMTYYRETVLQILRLYPPSPKVRSELEDLPRIYQATELSEDAQVTLFAIGHGMRLRVADDPSEEDQLVEGAKRHGYDRSPVAVEPQIVQELLASGLLDRMKRCRDANRLGWEAAGLDGENAAFYALNI